MTVYVQWNGDGRLIDPDKASKMPADGVESGVVFQTTQKRFDAMVEQGLQVEKVSKDEAAKLPAADAGDDTQEA